MNITLYGAASDYIDVVFKETVYGLGLEMARRGHTMVFGGGASGLMGAAADGMHDAGGKIIGITPHFMNTIEPIYEKCTEFIDTETLSDRKDKMETLADAFIIVPGGIGTFDEFFQILTLKKLGRLNKPIILLDTNGFWDNMLAVIGADIFKGFISPDIATLFRVCETPKSALDTAEKLCK